MQTIRNHAMTVTVDELGAQLMSITAADGTEYLWNGDPAYWTGRAPILFPYVGRLTNDRYTYDGKEYEMTRHGFAKRSEFTVLTAGKDHVTLHIEDTEESRKIYPFAFRFDVSWRGTPWWSYTPRRIWTIRPCSSDWAAIPASGFPWRRGRTSPTIA